MSFTTRYQHSLIDARRKCAHGKRSLKQFLRIILLLIVALLNSAQVLACNIHDLGHLRPSMPNAMNDSVAAMDSSLSAERTWTTEQSDAHCMHTSGIHCVAFASVQASTLFPNMLGDSGKPLAPSLSPTPPQSTPFRPPITS
jgi:hypothetical protein